MKKRFWKILAITVCILVVTTAVGGAICLRLFEKSNDFVRFDRQRLHEVCNNVTVLDCHGNVMDEPIYLNGYKQIALEELNPHTYMAFVSVEDKRFFEHTGWDVRRIAGATLNNLKSRSYKEGASTISQQLIKNTHLDNDKNIRRKLNEMMLAKQLEKQFDKKEILEMYLNTIYFGRNAYGIETAANVYFNKSASQLTIAESATLAGMIKAPNVYAPDKDAQKCAARRNAVLNAMLNQGVIDTEQHKQALVEQVHCCPQIVQKQKTYLYFVMQEACKLLNMTPMQLAKSNLTIETYCNQQTQRQLCNLAQQDNTCNKDGTLADLAAVIANNKGGVEACYFRGESSTAKRQAGSALKPIAVYAPALCERIITQASPILDEKTDFGGYSPSNAGGYNGWVTAKYAVAKSLNVPAVKTLNALTVAKSQNYLQKLGIDGQQDLSLALGNVAGGIDVLTLTKCYATLANNGLTNDVAFVKSISSPNGVIYTRKLTEQQVYTPDANYLMTDMLVNTAKVGTAKELSSLNFEVAAKTGTVGNSSGNTNAILAGYTTQHTFTLWYGGDMPNSVSGATAPCRFAKNILSNMYSGNSPQNFAPTTGVVEVAIDDYQLNQRQRLVFGNGQSFWFEKSYLPIAQPQKEKNEDEQNSDKSPTTDDKKTEDKNTQENKFPSVLDFWYW